MDLEKHSVSLTLKTDFEDAEASVVLWPLVDTALKAVGADEITFDAARNAMHSSNGSATLVNFLQSEGEKIKGMDFSFRAPLLCHVASLAAEDDGCDTIYDPEEAVIYIETDDAQFALPVIKDYRIDWKEVVDDVESEYEAVSDEEWALDRLLLFADIEVDAYRRPDDDL